SRGRFVAGVAAGAVATGALAGRRTSAAEGPARLSRLRPAWRVGVLLPRSNIRPTLGDSLLAGMRLGLEPVDGPAQRRRIELIPADTGLGPRRTLDEARRLIDGPRVHLP